MYYQMYQRNHLTLIMKSDGVYLTGLHFLEDESDIYLCQDNHLDVFDKTRVWLDDYFSKKVPSSALKLKINGTSFQKEVWEILQSIPYGKTMSYKDIASLIAKKRNIPKMSAQAVGQAIKRNPFAIIIPCHRVIGSDGKLTGYRWKIEYKKILLSLEGINKEI